MKVLNRTNCNIDIDGKVIPANSSRNMTLDLNNDKVKFLISSGSIRIMDLKTKPIKKVDKIIDNSTINNINTKSGKKKHKPDSSEQNTRLGDEKIDA